MENSHYRRSNSVYVGFSDSFYDFKDGEIGGWFDVGYRTGYNRETLIYGGIYAEYKDVYIKGALGTNLVGCTVGYIFRFEGIK